MMMKTTALENQAADGQAPGTGVRWVAERSVRRGDVPAARQFARAFGARVRLAPALLADFVLAVSEAVAAATAFAPGAARLRLWITGTRAFCEVRGDGSFPRQASRVRSAGQGEEEALRHLVLHQLADYVSVASGPDGPWVLLSMTVA